MSSKSTLFYQGIWINPYSDKKCEVVYRGVMVVKQGKIVELLSFNQAKIKYGKKLNAESLIDFGEAIIVPGFFDMHFHWVQDDVREMPKDSLLEWLEKYTFPTETKFANKKFAQEKAHYFFQRLTATGTLGGACYSSIHGVALDAAMKNAQGHFVIGNVLMNMHSPEALTQTEAESLKLTREHIRKFKRKFCFTPRFAITTTPRVMQEGSKISDKAGCFKQTHLSETPAEIDFVLSIYRKIPGFEKVKTYTEIYHKTGMLGKRSLMGHGIHLSPQELKVLARTKTSIIHCPTSNAPIKERGLGSGLFDFKLTEKLGVRWALGSDIGGGPFLSMLDVMGSFIEQNRKEKNKSATWKKALYRSTLAGAEILGINKRVGNFMPGKEANFVVLKPNFSKTKAKNVEILFEDLIMPYRKQREAYDHLVTATFFRGQQLFSSNKMGQ